MNVLVIVFSMRPRPDGDYLRFRNIFPRLSASHSLHLCYVDRHGVASYLDAYGQGFESVHSIPYGQDSALLGRIWSHVTFAPDCALRWRDSATYRRVRAAIAELVRSLGIDLVHCWEPCADQFADGLQVPVLFDMCDASSLDMRRSLRRNWRLGEYLRYLRLHRFEARIVKRFPCTFVTDADAAFFKRQRLVRVISNGVELGGADVGAEEDDVIAFSGNMGFPPNIDAVKYFYDEVFSTVIAERPSVRWQIIGTEPGPEVLSLAAHPNITVTGHVENIREHLSRATVVVCPMVTGTGIKNKVLEAMALGRAVVTTPLGMQGIAATPGVNIAVGGKPSEIAAKIIELLGNRPLREAMGRAGREYVARHHSWSGVTEEVEALYQELLKTRHCEGAGVSHQVQYPS
jgi:glycosyltransferase involved in cell wall biosynthesis